MTHCTNEATTGILRAGSPARAPAAPLLVGIVVAASLAHVRADETPVTAGAGEIVELLDAVSASGCEFQREGQWYLARLARVHLEGKLAQARLMTAVDTPERFISVVATRSSATGTPYGVRCPPGHEIRPAANWLEERLAVIRRSRAAR